LQKSTAILSFGEASAKQAFPEGWFQGQVEGTVFFGYTYAKAKPKFVSLWSGERSL